MISLQSARVEESAPVRNRFFGCCCGRDIVHNSLVYPGDEQYNIQVAREPVASWPNLLTCSIYSMVGALNKLPVAASGIIFFGDPANFGSVSAIGVGFFAGIIYAIAKNNQKREDDAVRLQDGVIPLANRNS